MNNNHKTVIVLNKQYELGRMISALGHVCFGLGASVDIDKAGLVTYVDHDGVEYPDVSEHSLIVLRAGGGQLRNLYTAARDNKVSCVAYLDSMFSGGSAAQQEATSQRGTADLEIIAVALTGPVDEIDPFTKKFSVWR